MPQTTRPNGLSFGDSRYVFVGQGDPSTRVGDDVEGAQVGSLYLRTDGGSSSTLYVREPAGWVAK